MVLPSTSTVPVNARLPLTSTMPPLPPVHATPDRRDRRTPEIGHRKIDRNQFTSSHFVRSHLPVARRTDAQFTLGATIFFTCSREGVPNPACVRDGYGVDFIVVSDRDSRADRIVNINSPRRLNTILQRRTGPDYNNILPECMDYTLAPAELLPAMPFPDSSPIHPMASCSPSGTINLERPHSIQPPALTFFRLFTSSIWDAPPSTTITWFTFQWVS